MEISEQFTSSFETRPEWHAWLRQLDINNSRHALQSIAQGEMPKGGYSHLKQFMENQLEVYRQICEL